MEFGKLLSVAQKNRSSKQKVSYYSTKFTPPKKETKQSKNLSENIKKFLARKDEEEKLKSLEEKKKRENLLALRDHKAQSRINKHLKVCKAANKSVLADAVNTEDTAITMAGPSQPDEDDYGYVSQEASAFYDRLMNKYNSLPPDKPLFSDSGKRVIKDISSTKDRVKQALKQQEIDDALPNRHKKRKSLELAAEIERRESERDRESPKEIEREREKDVKVKKKKPMPPPIDFVSLLKLAEKKQYEPVVLEPKPKPKSDDAEFDRPMTKKQKKEFMKEKEWRDKKERERNGDKSVNSSVNSLNSGSSLNGSSSLHEMKSKSVPIKSNPKPDLKAMKATNSFDSKNLPSKSSHLSHPSTKTNLLLNSSNCSNIVNNSNSRMPAMKAPKPSEKDEILEERRKLEMEKKKLESMRRMIEEEKKKLALETKNKKIPAESKSSSNKPANKSNEKVESSLDSRKDNKNRLSSDMKPRCADVKPKQFPPADCYPKPRQFPPPDVLKRKPKSSINGNGRLSVNKRRILDDDEDDHDSELDDFIDDAPQDETADYSKYISEIFGYDKRKYRNFDDDDTNMESNYAQQLKEEFVSTKIGIMEDLEDIRQEALEKKRKAMMMKKIKKK